MFVGKKCHHWKFLFLGIAEENGNRRKTMLVQPRAWVCIGPSWQTVITTQVWICFLICWNEPALFVLSVCFMQFKEWVFLLNWFYLLIPGAVWGTQSLDVRCKFLKHILKALHTVPNSLHSENCYHWGKSFPCLNQSE